MLSAANVDNVIPNKSGEVNVSVAAIWETLDNTLDGLKDRLPFIIVGFFVFAVFYLMAGVFRKLIRQWTDGKESANLGRVLVRIAQWLTIVIGLIVGVLHCKLKS